MHGLLPAAILIAAFAAPAAAEGKSVDFVLLKYKVLNGDAGNFYQNAHYAFEVCGCSSASYDPKLSSYCTCEDLRGRTVRESMPIAEYDGSCRLKRDSHPSHCLIASLESLGEIPYLYLRVSANGYVLSRPGWQELVAGEEEDEVLDESFASVFGTPIELSYILTGTSGVAVTPITALESTTAISTTSTTTAPHASSNGLGGPWSPPRPQLPLTNDVTEDFVGGDYLRYASISNLNQLKSILFTEAIRDRTPAWKIDLESYKHEILNYHNALRGLHGSPPLEYDLGVEMAAQRWADYLGSRASCILHDPNRRHGECLFYFGALVLPNPKTFAALTTQSFYLENSFYDYYNYRPMAFYRTGHFTQMIWRNSRRMGVGVSIRLAAGGGAPCRPYAPTYQIFVVVKYDPPGNVQGSYNYQMNVRPRQL